MADKTIWEYPTLATADPDDLILMASDETTYNMQVATLKAAMGEAASKPPVVRNGNWWVWSAAQNDYVDSGTAATGPQGPTGDTGAAAGFGTVSATVDSNVGTPSVDITTSGPDTAKNIAFEFHNIKGTKGDTGNTGAAAGFGTVSATVDSNVGTPSVDITTSGPDTAKNISFAFHNIKGDVTPAAQQAVSDAQAAAQAASENAQDAEAAAAEVEQKLDGASAYGEVGPVAIASIQDASQLNAEKLVVGIEPVQDLHGYDHPWPAGGGKNKFDKTTLSDIDNYTNSVSGYLYTDKIQLKPNTQYIIKAKNSGNVGEGIYYVLYHVAGSDPDAMSISSATIIYPVYNGNLSTSQYQTFTTEETGVIRFGVANSTELSAIMTTDWQLEEGSTATAWSPYSNICPITGWTGAEVTVNEDVLDITFPAAAGTVYGGTLDVVNGVLTVDRAIVVFDGTESSTDFSIVTTYDARNRIGWDPYERIGKVNGTFLANVLETIANSSGSDEDKEWRIYGSTIAARMWISVPKSIASVSDFITFCASTNISIVYELATPITYQLIPQHVTLLQGENHIFADCGDTTVGYWRDDSLSINRAITERAYDRQQGEALADNVGALSAAMTYVVNGNKSIESVTIPVGAYVRLVGSTIAGRSDGIYTVATEIPVNTVIDGTYFNESAPIQGGGLNAIQQSLANVPFMMSNSNTWTTLNYSIQNRNGILMTTPVDGFYAFGLRGTGNGGVTTRIALKSDYSDWLIGSQVQAMVDNCVYLRAGTTVYARMDNGGRIDCYGYYT